MNRTRGAAMVAALVLAAATAGRAQIVKHVGSNDPVTEGWLFSSSGSGVTVSGGTEPTGTNYWEIQTASGKSASYAFSLTPTVFSTGWIAAGRWRLPSETTSSPPPALDNDALIVEDSTSAYFLGLVNNGASGGLYYYGQSSFAPLALSTFTVDTNHYYLVEMRKNLSTSRVDVFLDSAFQGSLSAFGSGGPNPVHNSGVGVTGGINDIRWGDTTGDAAVTTERWNFVSFDVPEPSALWLLSLGGLVLWQRRKAT